MSSVILNVVANVTNEQIDSTQKIHLGVFHSPLGPGVVQPGLQKDAELLLMVLLKPSCCSFINLHILQFYRGKESEEGTSDS